ncbi:hypothetical protein MHYP_G00230470 [Metynnis hypsauchen]
MSAGAVQPGCDTELDITKEGAEGTLQFTWRHSEDQVYRGVISRPGAPLTAQETSGQDFQRLRTYMASKHHTTGLKDTDGRGAGTLPKPGVRTRMPGCEEGKFSSLR